MGGNASPHALQIPGLSAVPPVAFNPPSSPSAADSPIFSLLSTPVGLFPSLSAIQVHTQQLMDTACAAPFLSPVDPERDGAPGYYDIIAFPMDLRTMLRKMESGEYTRFCDYHRDFALMIDNSRTYNPYPVSVSLTIYVYFLLYFSILFLFTRFLELCFLLLLLLLFLFLLFLLFLFLLFLLVLFLLFLLSLDHLPFRATKWNRTFSHYLFIHSPNFPPCNTALEHLS